MSSIPQIRAYDEVVAFLASGPSREAIVSFRLSEETVARVRLLRQKKSAETLTADEAEELDECVQLDRIVLLLRSQARQQMQAARGA